MQTHTHTHIKQAASVGSARCWRHIRFMVESWRPAGSSSVTQTDSSGSSTSQAPLLLAHCCCKNLLHIHYRRRTPTASTHCLKGHTCIFGKNNLFSPATQCEDVKVLISCFKWRADAVSQFETAACWVEASSHGEKKPSGSKNWTDSRFSIHYMKKIIICPWSESLYYTWAHTVSLKNSIYWSVCSAGGRWTSCKHTLYTHTLNNNYINLFSFCLTDKLSLILTDWRVVFALLWSPPAPEVTIWHWSR